MTTIGFLATGDEITNGEIVNSNSQQMADVLFNAGFSLGNQVCCTDREQDIVDALQYLIQQHQVVIITGGLGPTTDDRTRFALATFLQRELILDQASLDKIAQRFKELNLLMADGNRQQALFPRDATIMPNTTGSAPGCWVRHAEKFIILLPGPPSECLPMFQSYVLPLLQTHCQISQGVFKRWRLFAVSESHIAEQLETLVKDQECVTGYRFHRPYLDCKLRLYDPMQANGIFKQIDALFQPFIICPENSTASAEWIACQLKHSVTIEDHATFGALQAALTRPSNLHCLQFAPLSADKSQPSIRIEGLNEYWQGQSVAETQLIITTQDGQQIIRSLPQRGIATLAYAVEYIAYMLKTLFG